MKKKKAESNCGWSIPISKGFVYIVASFRRDDHKMNTIKINKLAIDTIIGVYAHEKLKKQRLYLSLTLDYDFSKATQSDSLKDTLDYAMLSQALKEVLENSQYELIERVAGVVAEILESHYAIERYRIEVEKPSALEDADSVCVIIDNHQSTIR